MNPLNTNDVNGSNELFVLPNILRALPPAELSLIVIVVGVPAVLLDIKKSACSAESVSELILINPLSSLTVLLTASTNIVESSPAIVPLKFPVILADVILGAATAPVNVAAPAFISFDVALKKLVLSVALTSPLNVPEALMAPVALFTITAVSYTHLTLPTKA